MKVAVCFNRASETVQRGEKIDRISEAGAELEAEAVSAALKKLGHDTVLIALEEQIVPFLEQVRKSKPAVIFNLCEGFAGDSGCEMHVAALFELLDIPYTGSNPLTLGLTQNKALTKDLLVRHQLSTPAYHQVKLDEPLPELDFSHPWIIKPCNEDASLGLNQKSVVSDKKRLKRRVSYIHERYQQPALVEEFITGREFNVSVLGGSVHRVLPIGEIVFHDSLPYSIVSYKGKWFEKSSEYKATEVICPAQLTEAELKTIEKTVTRACQLVSCRDYARVDIRWRDGVPYILEINANPDISPDAGLARAAKTAGIDYPALIGRIINMAMTRKGGELVHA